MANSCNSYIADVTDTVYPATRGSFKCCCRGEVVEMCGKYGWIAAFAHIDHPDAAKRQGHVYVQKRDVQGRDELAAGDVVTFYLYADGQGLGAEYCCREALDEPLGGFDPSPCNGQGLQDWAQALPYLSEGVLDQLKPPPGLGGGSVLDQLKPPPGLGGGSAAATPSWFGGASAMDAHASVFVPSMPTVTANHVDSATAGWSGHAMAFALRHGFTDDSDSDSDCSSSADEEDIAVWDCKLNAVAMPAAAHCKGSDTDPLSRSTCDGESSDSDWENQTLVSLSPTQWIRPPPGLSLYD